MVKTSYFFYNLDMDYIEIGKIINTFGIKGELKIESHTDFVEERFKRDSFIYIGRTYEKFQIRSYRIHQGFLLIKLCDYEDINLVEKYKGQLIYKAKEDIKPLENGEYYFSDLRGLNVYVDDNLCGRIKDVEEGLRYNYLRVLKDNGEEVLVPYLPVFVKNVELNDKRIDIIKMDGLL